MMPTAHGQGHTSWLGGMAAFYVRPYLRIAVFLPILASLFLLDIATTEIILMMGGVELNPIMAGIVVSPMAHILLKTAIFLIIFIVSLIAEHRVEGSGIPFYGILIVLYIVVVAHNIAVILPRVIA